MKNEELPNLPPHIVKAWLDAGAEVGWMRFRKIGWLNAWQDSGATLGGLRFMEFGSLDFFRDERESPDVVIESRERRLAEVVPAFFFPKWIPGVVKNLPAPEAAFGLDLHGVTDAELKELVGLKACKRLALILRK